MDRKFLKEITEGYITKHNVYSQYTPKQVDIIRDKIYEDLCELTTEVRELDQELYDSVYFSNRLYQYSVIENYLNIRFESDIVIDEEEQLNEGLIWNSITTLGNFIVKLFSVNIWFSSFLSLLIIIVFWVNRHALSKNFFKLLSSLGELMEWSGQVMAKQGRYFQFRYSIIQKNFQECYRKCNVRNLDRISPVEYINKYVNTTGFDEGIRIFSDTNRKCLTNCFVDTMISLILVNLDQYITCLKINKQNDQIEQLSTIDFFVMLRSKNYEKYGFKGNIACNEFLDIATDFTNKLDSLLDYVYGDDITKKREIMNHLSTQITQLVKKSSTDNRQQIKDFKYHKN